AKISDREPKEHEPKGVSSLKGEVESDTQVNRELNQNEVRHDTGRMPIQSPSFHASGSVLPRECSVDWHQQPPESAAGSLRGRGTRARGATALYAGVGNRSPYDPSPQTCDAA